jgi:hypothetical protein
MDAQPLLGHVLQALRLHRLEVVLIGNAAAALHGAPVTTLDFDFMFRETPLNMEKLKAVSRTLDAVILRPFYPVSKLYRMVNDDQGLQLDFMPAIHGVRSFNSLRSRSITTEVAGCELRLASLGDIIAANAPRIVLATAPCSKSSNEPLKRKSPRPQKRKEALAALAGESDRQLTELIRRRLALPMEKRMNFLRVRLPGGGSAL